MDDRIERRQHPRVAMRNGTECRLDVRSRVRMVDISASGTLVATDLALPVGCQVNLRSNLGNGPFACGLEVRRHANVASRGQSPALGAIFTEMDEQSRRSLEQFLKRASTA